MPASGGRWSISEKDGLQGNVMSECKHSPTGQNRRRFAFLCAHGRGVLPVPMEVRGALEKGGKNKVLHLEKLQFKCISTKGGCVLAYGAFETSEGRAGLGTWGSPAENQQLCCREGRSKALGEGSGSCSQTLTWPLRRPCGISPSSA